WTQLELIAEHGVDYGFLDPQLVRMRLYNHAEVPLSLGPGATLPPTAFVLLDPRVAGTSLGDLPPLVVDLGRKLRLEPREFVEVPVRIDQAFLGLLMTFNPDKTFDYNVQVIYDPRFDH